MPKSVESAIAVKLVSSSGNILTITFDLNSGDVFRVTKTPLETINMVDTGYVPPAPNEFQVCQLVGHVAMGGDVAAQGFTVLATTRVSSDHILGAEPFPAHEMVKEAKKRNAWPDFFVGIIGPIMSHVEPPKQHSGK